MVHRTWWGHGPYVKSTQYMWLTLSVTKAPQHNVLSGAFSLAAKLSKPNMVVMCEFTWTTEPQQCHWCGSARGERRFSVGKSHLRWRAQAIQWLLCECRLSPLLQLNCKPLPSYVRLPKQWVSHLEKSETPWDERASQFQIPLDVDRRRTTYHWVP